MISKELLSEVLKEDLHRISRIDQVANCIHYKIYNDFFEDTYYAVNIYELAYKCKEWILNQKNKDCFYIADQLSLNIESQMGAIKYFWCVLLKNNSRVSPEFKADTEIECILKASEYILKEINE